MNKAECIFEKNGYAKTHGELTLEGLKKLIGKISTKGKVFVDMGSGNGSVIINMINYKYFKYDNSKLLKKFEIRT